MKMTKVLSGGSPSLRTSMQRCAGLRRRPRRTPVACLTREAVVEHQWEVFEREHWEHFEELTLLQTQVSEVCLAVVGHFWVRNCNTHFLQQ
jgi:hypothetical protein